MSDDKLSTQQRPEGNIGRGPTVRDFRMVGLERSLLLSAVSDHFVDVNKMVDPVICCHGEVTRW